MANLLQLLGLSGRGVPRAIPSIDPTTGLPVSGPTISDPTGGLGMSTAAAMPAPDVTNTPAIGAMAPQDITSNIMQALGGSPDAPQPAPVSQTPQPAAAPHERRSLLDTVGRISDVLARVGGAEALYQPTLDAREDRLRAVDIEGMRKQLLEQQIGAGDAEASGRQQALLGAAMRGLQAIKRRGGDVAAAWPVLAQQAGIPPERAAALSEIFAQDPNAVDAIASMAGQEQEFGLQPFYAQGPDGQLRAYQLGKDGSIQAVQLGEGETPIDPLKFVDTGGAQVGVGTRSGGVRRILPNSVSPDTAANIGSRERIANAGNASRERVASTRTAGKEEGGNAGMVETARGNLGELRDIYKDLRDMGALVSPDQSTGANIAARARSSGIGQMLEGAVGTEAQTLRDRVASIRPALLQSIAQATGMTGRQLDSNSDVKLFMQTVTDPSTSYEANIAAIDGLERFLRAHSRQPAAASGGGARITPRAVPRSVGSGGANAAALAEARRRGLIQ